MASDFTELRSGSRIAGYLIEEKIGAGGMAVVFRARDEMLGRFAAVKVIASAMADDAEFRARFLRESRAAAAVNSLHIIPVYAAGESEGLLYIATRFVPGGDLATLLRHAGGRLAPERVASLVLQVGSALDAAHAAGLVHRDVKPANILVDTVSERSEHAYLSDFGLSKGTRSSTGLTASGQFVGTPDYCAPEQIRSSHVDGRSDQYALGCVAFALLTGIPPFHRTETVATLFAHLQDPVPLVTRLRPELPAGIDGVIARVLAKSPAERYESCGEFAAALQSALVAVIPAGVLPRSDTLWGDAVVSGASRTWADGRHDSRSQERRGPLPSTSSSLISPQPPWAAALPRLSNVDLGSSTQAAFRPHHGASARRGLAHASTVARPDDGRRDLTRPVRGERGLTWHHRRKAALIGATVVVSAVAAVLTVLMLPSSHSRAGLASASVGRIPSPSISPTRSLSRPSPSKSPSALDTPRPLTLKPIGANSFNPYDAGSLPDNPSMAAYAIDDSLTTAWSTGIYLNNPEFGGLKSGTGLVIDMGKPVTLSSVTVTFGRSKGADVLIEVGNDDSPSASTLSTFITVAAKTNVGGTSTFTSNVKATGRYVLIWITKLPPDSMKSDENLFLGAAIYRCFIYNVILQGSS